MKTQFPPSRRSGLTGVRRIAVFRALQLGDMLCAVPALRALRAAAPSAHITLIGLPWAADFARRFRQYIDDFVAFPGAPGLPEQTGTPEALSAFYCAMQERGFDLALQLHGDGSVTNEVVQHMGAQDVAGFYPAGTTTPPGPCFIPYPNDVPEIRRLLRLIEALDVPTRGENLEFAISGDEWKELARLRAAYGLRPGEYVCIHPGARAASRRWPPERFGAVADRIAAKGLRVVLTGTPDEKLIVHSVVRAMHAGAINLVAQTPLGVLAALYAGARAVVCNDTGVSHLAAALCVPSVVIATGSDAARWAPLDPARHRVLTPAPGDDITVEHVTAAALALIGGVAGRRAAM